MDGLVDAGVLTDDSPKYVSGVNMLAPERGDREGVVLTLTEVE